MEENENMQEQQGKQSFWKRHGGDIVTALLLLLFASSLFLGLWKPVIVQQTSMYPTLQEKDYLFIIKTGNYDRGDIVVFNSEAAGEKYLIKRIVALEGDTLCIRDGRVFLNGEELKEDYLADGLETLGDLELTVSEDCCFVMGDNRPVSIDSRSFGEVRLAGILGEVKLRLYHRITLF